MFRVFGQLSWFFKEEWKRYTIAIILLIIVSFIDLMPARLLGLLVDDFQLGSLTLERGAMYAGILLLITFMSYGLTYIWMSKLFGGALVVERKLRSKFMNHLLRMDVPFYEKRKTGDLMAQGTNDLKAVSMTAGFGILTLVDSVVFMLIILGAMIILVDWKLTLAAVLPLPLIGIMISILGIQIHARFTKAQEAFGSLNGRVLESVAGMRVIRAFRKERQDENKFNSMSEDVYKRNLEVAKIESFFEPVVNIVVALSYVIGLGYGSYLVFAQQITLGQLITFNVYLGMMIWPMFAIGELINIMQRGGASLQRVNQTLSVDQAVKEPKQPVATEDSASILFDQLSFSYPTSELNQLEDLCLEIQSGETIGIVGKTGSGKSTLIKQLLKYYPSGKGVLTVGEQPIGKQTKSQVREKIGYVPQDHILFSKTVRENILFGHSNATDAELDEAIRISAFEQDLDFLPDGLDTLVGENGVSLSGGQKQRISIARALIANPPILILDDSLSAVDAKTEAKIVKMLREVREGQTTIITAHRMSAVEQADQIIVLDEGHKAELGTHKELMANQGWYYEQVQQQTRGMEQEVR
ncbi:ABC transporter ATP-binding protein [Alkalicoccobacillus porphyridii]|uniref:ABC transporter ATP-binding protein n=1 Tax=Alkalicoccobacillus porphyridii TaxID=2597270 RepID=A0A553ZT77_9BACI|nr:ABC transporter ATP-binding protein [Alkalicoccobacillus porphyridii]TSB44684.1 ABC transporter ATP-binding protein [Alkalicoccobacillus porphyridii]